MRSTDNFHFHTILVATDLSQSATEALRYAQALARVHRARIVITHVIDPVGYAFPSGLPGSLAADAAAREEVRRMEDETRRQGIQVQSEVQSGIICDRILQSVRETHADLLILGTRAHTSAGKAALGAVARQLLARTPCPVLAIPARMATGAAAVTGAAADTGAVADAAKGSTVHAAAGFDQDAGKAEIRLPRAGVWPNVLIATDFSVASLEALDYAARVTCDHLTVLHAEPCREPQLGGGCLERLRFLAPFNESHTLPVDHVVKQGEASQLICAEAERMQADLVVIGAPGEEFAEQDLSGSTVLQVITGVNCPVLCVPSTLASQFDKVVEEVA